MLFEAGKALSFMLSMLSLYPVVMSAFFVPGTHWEERLGLALVKIAMAGCVCLASGILFAWPAGNNRETLLRTLPVQIFLWTVAGVAVLFALSWCLDIYYVPLLWRNQP